MRRVLGTIVVALCFGAAAAVSPEAASARPSEPQARVLLLHATESWNSGDRVRVTTGAPYRVNLTGRFQSLAADSILRLRPDGSQIPVEIGLSRIGTLSEHAGTRRHWKAGVLIGFVVGLGVGALVRDAEDEPGQPFNELNTYYLPIGAMAGAVAGGAIGALVRSDRWFVVARFD